MSNPTVANTFANAFQERQTSRASGAGAHRLSDSFVWGSLLLLAVLVAIPYGTVEPWWLAVFECSVFVLTAFAVVQKSFAPPQSLSLSWRGFGLLVPVLLVALYAFVQAAAPAARTNTGWEGSVSADAFETRLWAVKLLAYLFFGALLFSYTSTERRLRALIYTVIGLGIASAIFGLLRQGLQHDAGFLLPYLQTGSGYAQFINKNHFAFLLEMALGLLMGLVLGGGVRMQLWPVVAAAVVLMWTALVMTSSRGAVFTALAQIGFAAAIAFAIRLPGKSDSTLTWDRRRPARNPHAPKLVQASREGLLLRFFALRAHCGRDARGPSAIVGRLVLIVFVVGVVAVSAVWLGGDLLTTRLRALSGEVSAPAGETHAGVRRQEVWRSTLALIKAHPLVGSGLGAYGVAITPFHDGSGKWTPEAAHNDYLELAASGGLIAVALALWFVINLVRRAKQQLQRRAPFARAAGIGALTGLFGVAIHSAVDFGLHVTVNTVVFIALVVIATREFQGARSKGPREGAPFAFAVEV
jgi:hypothetical protein